jgi:hypothetical protein
MEEVIGSIPTRPARDPLAFQSPIRLPSAEPVAFHDLAVGLTCFDRVFLPLEAVATFHDRASSEVFWPLMQSGAIKFVDAVHLPFYLLEPESMYAPEQK